MEKQKGGLCIRNLCILNKVLLGKWSWRFVSERNPVWKQVSTRKKKEGGVLKK